MARSASLAAPYWALKAGPQPLRMFAWAAIAEDWKPKSNVLARLAEAVAAYRLALEERTRERVPLEWARTQNNLGNALWALGERESGTARLDEAVAAYRAALEERTRARVPLDWALTQNNLGNALDTLGTREEGTGHLKEAVAAWELCLTVLDTAWHPEWVQDVRSHRDKAEAEIARGASK